MRKRILVADDTELIRRQVRRILELDQQIEICAEAENGVEAVRKARKYHPDLVLIDVFMPEMNGLAAVREIKKTAPQVPVVVFTLHDTGGIQIESQKAGADAFLLKANGGVELLPTIHELLGSYSEPIAA
jgi:DNA-binding NarL/FixJ family response regulator